MEIAIITCLFAKRNMDINTGHAAKVNVPELDKR